MSVTQTHSIHPFWAPAVIEPSWGEASSKQLGWTDHCLGRGQRIHDINGLARRHLKKVCERFQNVLIIAFLINGLAVIWGSFPLETGCCRSSKCVKADTGRMPKERPSDHTVVWGVLKDGLSLGRSLCSPDECLVYQKADWDSVVSLCRDKLRDYKLWKAMRHFMLHVKLWWCWNPPVRVTVWEFF